MDCFGTYFTHAQACDNVRVKSATQWTASVHTLHMHALTCDNVRVSCSKCYAMDCFGTYFTHAQACDNVRVKSATQWTASVHTLHMHALTCDNVRVQSATQWTASVHTLHMPKPVITFVFKVLRNGLLPYILYTCPSL